MPEEVKYLTSFLSHLSGELSPSPTTSILGSRVERLLTKPEIIRE